MLSPSNDEATAALATANGFQTVDVRLTLARSLVGFRSDPSLYSRHTIRALREATPSDLPALRQIAAASHGHFRFFHDDHFPRDKCRELYARWIEGNANLVLVHDPGDGPLGYVTVHLDPVAHTGSLGLLAVDANARGSGIGRAMAEGAFDWLTERGATSVSLVSQGRNVEANALHTRCGFTPTRCETWRHKW